MGRGSSTVDTSAGAVRAQTAVLGLVLLIGVVAVTSVGILTIAGETTADVSQQAETDRVERSFVDFSREVRASTASTDVARSVALPDEHGDVRVVENGALDVRVGGDSILGDGTDAPVPLRSIEYTGDDGSVIAYQGGGVWRGTGADSKSVSTPPIYSAERTLTLPAYVVTGDRINDGTASLSAIETNTRHAGYVDHGPVTVTITSPYYAGWVDAFESLAGVAVSVQEPNETAVDGAMTVVATFDVVEEIRFAPVDVTGTFDRAAQLEGGIDTSSGGTIEGDVLASEDSQIRMGVTGDVIVDGDVVITSQGEGVDGDVIATGEVRVEDDVGGSVIGGGGVVVTDQVHEIGGSVVSGGDVVVDPGTIGGPVYATGSIEYGWINDHDEFYAGGEIVHKDDPNFCEYNDCRYQHQYDGSIEDRIAAHLGTDVDAYVEALIPTRYEPLDDEIRGWIDEADADEFEPIGNGELSSGIYYASSVDVSDELVFDVAEGDVDVIVDGDVSISGDVRVKNPSGGTVRLWTAGDFEMAGGPSVCPGTGPCPDPADADASVIQTYATSTSMLTFQGGTTYHGIIYAPQGEYRESNLHFTGGGSIDFVGSLVTGGFESNGQLTMTHDEDLAETYEPPTDPIERAERDSTEDDPDAIRYLNVATYEVDVEPR